MRGRGLLLPTLVASAATLASILSPPEAAAQICGSGIGRYVVRIQPGALVFPTPVPDDFAVGWIEHGPVELDIRPRGNANRPWVVCMRADSPDMGGGKPLSDLQYRADGRGAWTSMTPGDRLLAQGEQKKGRVTLQFRILLDAAADQPGTYRVDYTVTAARP